VTHRSSDREARCCLGKQPRGAPFIFHDGLICGEYCREFDEISRGEFGRRWHGDVPRAYNVQGVPVRALFAPDHTPELELIKQILKAERRIDFPSLHSRARRESMTRC
jgi:hypothetical protein